MTAEQRRHMLAVVSANIGFDEPEAWLDYAWTHHFQRVYAFRLTRCPDCGSLPGRRMGKYVYYSTLMRLTECQQCGLVWSDVRLDEAVIRRHFESAYKDTDYFARQRHTIFQQVAAEVAARTPQGGSVLDIGGATGELLGIIRGLRPDVRLTLNDVSISACEIASAKFGVETRCGTLPSLIQDATHYDTVVCSDVLYYEPHIDQVWPALAQLVNARGTLLIRVPNRALAIAATQRWYRFTAHLAGRANDPALAHVPLFNPEHLYILRRAYIEQRLIQNGFRKVVAGPSHSLCGGLLTRMLTRTVYLFAVTLWHLSSHRAILTPSMLIIASRQPGRGDAVTSTMPRSP
jgi:SAM-dependent methyltransferase